jgi:hypothetical protein
VALTLERKLDHIIIAWLALGALACATRIAASPLPVGTIDTGSILAYPLMIIVPAASILLALRWFADSDQQPQPRNRLAVIGRWRNVSRSEARCHPLYGTSGIMVSLLIGLLLNIPVRLMEYLVAVPPVPNRGPIWVETLQFTLALDAILFTSLYGIAFVAALRRVPLFPRLLLVIWMGDLMMQVIIAELVITTATPAGAAMALSTLLNGNINKVLISVGLWVPYLTLSRRVNLTYRSRLPAEQ